MLNRETFCSITWGFLPSRALSSPPTGTAPCAPSCVMECLETTSPCLPQIVCEYLVDRLLCGVKAFNCLEISCWGDSKGQGFCEEYFKSPSTMSYRAVSTFWIAHPNNHLINNAAAGSQVSQFLGSPRACDGSGLYRYDVMEARKPRQDTVFWYCLSH